MPYKSISSSRPSWAAPVAALAERVIGPGAGDRIVLTQTRASSREFRAEARGGTLHLAAGDPLAACVGLHHFLRAAYGVSVSWDTALPLQLGPFPDHPPISGTARVQDVYYLNFCTFSYTTAFWDWAEWEREIDWMALHGISMPLAAVGHEAVLAKALQRLGLTDQQVRAHLGSPAYLPFQYMGCLEGGDGTLTQEWIDAHLDLGRQILHRERELGMTPVLPAFTGSIPPDLPCQDARWRTWQGFPTKVLTPADPLYRRLTRDIAQVQQELLGTNHLYAADPFIEMVPVDDGLDYPGQVAQATLAGLVDADPAATWVLQAWPFSNQPDYWTDDRVTRFLDAIDNDRIQLLDLWAEQKPQWTERAGFGGKPWLWCALLNFGGRTDLIADLASPIRQVEQALSSAHPPAGLGLTMEGIHTNPLYFELVLDLAWTSPATVDDWLRDAIPQRYGLTGTSTLHDAWAGLASTVYARRHDHIEPDGFHNVVTSRPSYAWLDSPHTIPRPRFDPDVLVRAWQDLLTVAEECGTTVPAPLERDLVDVAAAALLLLADHRLAVILGTARKGHVAEELGAAFLSTFTELDQVVASRPESRWATWEAGAGRWDAPDSTDVVRGARQLLTTWGSEAGHRLDDYAARVWGGLTGGYYRARWSAWLDGLADASHGDRARAETLLDARLHELAAELVAHGVGAVSHDATGDAPAPSPTQAVRRAFDLHAAAVIALPSHDPAEEAR